MSQTLRDQLGESMPMQAIIVTARKIWQAASPLFRRSTIAPSSLETDWLDPGLNMWKMQHMESKIQGILRIAMVENGRSFLSQRRHAKHPIGDMISLCSGYRKNCFVEAAAECRSFACENGRTLLSCNNNVVRQKSYSTYNKVFPIWVLWQKRYSKD